jgi:ATP-dependent helicase/nuclease subunit A
MDITGIEARLVRHRLSPALAPLLRQLLTSPATSALFGPEAQAEAAIAGEIEGLPPVRGQIDRLLIQNDGIWLVDFKTGRRSDSAPEHYVQQMAQYAALLTNAYPGRALRAALLWTQDAQLEELDSARLSRALDQLRQVHRERVA